MRVVRSAPAHRGRDAIRAYLRAFDTVAARRAAQALLLAGDSLALFPLRGRVDAAPGTRELVAVQPYVFVHEVTDDGVVILAV